MTTRPCERCARQGDRQRIRTIQSARLQREVHLCRFDDECKPTTLVSVREQIVEVMEVGDGRAQVIRLEASGTRVRTKSKSEPMPLDAAIEEAGWLSLCLAWRRRQDVRLRLRLRPVEGQLNIDHEMVVEPPETRPEVG